MIRDILSLVIVLCFSYTGQVLMKRGVNEIGITDMTAFHATPLVVLKAIFTNAKIILGFLSAGVGAIIYLMVLARLDLTLAMPILGALGFAMLPIIGWVFLQEPLNPMRIIGTLVISIGMVIVALS